MNDDPGWTPDQLEHCDLHAARTWLLSCDFGPAQPAATALIHGCGPLGIRAAVEALNPSGWDGFRDEQAARRSEHASSR